MTDRKSSSLKNDWGCEKSHFWGKIQDCGLNTDAWRLRQQLQIRITKWVRDRDWRGKDSHLLAWPLQWSVEAAAVCWGQVSGAVELEQYPCTGGPCPNQPRNVEEEALETMCSVPRPFWVPPISALFCFQAGENRKACGLRPRRKGRLYSQLKGLLCTLSALNLL